MGKGTELEIKQDSFLAPNGLYNLKTIKATPWGGLDYRFNAKGRDMKLNPDLFSVQGKTIKDENGDLVKELTIQIIGFNLIDCQKQILFSEEHESTKLWCEIMFLDENKLSSAAYEKQYDYLVVLDMFNTTSGTFSLKIGAGASLRCPSKYFA